MTDTSNRNRPQQQMRMPLSVEPASGREDFIVTKSNADAVELVDQWPNWPHPMIALVGAAGTGKSHLASAWARQIGAMEISAREIGDCDLPSLVSARAVLVEDADRLLSSENALFHLFNLVREHDTTMMLTARELPSAWPVKLPDLASRLRAVIVAKIGQPDDALLSTVLVKLFTDRQINVERQVIDYLVVRMERSMAAAHELVAALDDEAMTLGRGVTKGVARRVLEELND